jgi:hypothetical protein
MGFLVYALVALVIAVAVGALIIMLATKIVAGFKPSFMMAAVTALAASIASAVVQWLVTMVVGAGGLSSLLCLVAVFVIYAAIINALIKPASGGQMGFGKAALVTLVVIIIEIILAVVLFFVFGAALMGMMGGAMH